MRSERQHALRDRRSTRYTRTDLFKNVEEVNRMTDAAVSQRSENLDAYRPV